MKAVLSHPGGDLVDSFSMIRSASIRFFRDSRSKTSWMCSRRILLQLIPSTRSIFAFVSSSTRTVIRGTDTRPYILYIWILAARRKNGPRASPLSRLSVLAPRVPHESPDLLSDAAQEIFDERH